MQSVEPGEVWSYEEADLRAHEFLVALAGNRDISEYVEDPVEHARVNALMLLFNDEVAAAFETYLARMPAPRAQAWLELISGGVSADVFGPLTLQEHLDERQIGTLLRAARKRRIVSALLTVAVITVLLVGGVVLWNQLTSEESRRVGGLNFGVLDDSPNEAALIGGPPLVEPSLTAVLSATVAVLAGNEPLAERLESAPENSFAYSPGALSATVFQYAGSGHVLFVGPAGFVDSSCLRASVVTADLRPLDVVTSGPCQDPVGRVPTIGCVGPTAVLMDLRVPNGTVDLPEGGSGFADAVRVQLVGNDDRFELLSIVGTIEVAADESVVVPRFGAAPGDELIFDFGAGQVASCTVTGDLPQQR